MIKLKQFEHGRHALQKVVRQKVQQNKLQDELNNVIETEQKSNAASTIQNAIKSRKARSELKQNKELKTISNAVVGDMQNQIIKQQEPYKNAASTIQGAVKGYKARKAMNQEQLSLQGEKQIKQQQAKQLLSQIQPQTDLSTRLKTTRKPFIPPNIQTIESKQQREQSLRDIIRQVEDTNEPLYTLSQSSDKAATKIGKVIKGHLSRKDIRNEILKQASNEKTAATTLQSAIRKRRANQNYTMRQNQVIAEAELKQMEAAKDKAIKDDAAKKLQASIKRVKPQNNLNQIKQAKAKIGAVSKSLLTEKVDTLYGDSKRAYITNKNTVGQRLVVNKRLKLVSKAKHDAGVFGYETRQDYLDLAQRYKPTMTKGQKKK